MDFFIELIGELIIEGSFELATNKKVNKWIRYPLLGVLIILYSIIMFGILFIGINSINENFWVSIFLIVISLVLFIGTIVAVKRKLNSKEKK